MLIVFALHCNLHYSRLSFAFNSTINVFFFAIFTLNKKKIDDKKLFKYRTTFINFSTRQKVVECKSVPRGLLNYKCDTTNVSEYSNKEYDEQLIFNKIKIISKFY